jgi:hypothetical protein
VEEEEEDDEHIVDPKVVALLDACRCFRLAIT